MFVRLRYLRFVAALATLTSLAACSKDDPKPAADPKGISWTVDGANVTAMTTTKDTSDPNVIELTGAVASTTSASQVGLFVPKKVGTYNLADSNSDATALYITGTANDATFYGAETGTITVTSLTATSVVGTFTFTGEGADFSGSTKPAKTISNGKFNIAL